MEDKDLKDETKEETKAETANERNEEEQPVKYTLFYIAVGCFAAGIILFALTVVFTFAVANGIAIYFLIASMLTELCCLSFLNSRKQKYGEGKAAKIIRVCGYAVMIAAAIIFVAGTAVNATAA